MFPVKRYYGSPEVYERKLDDVMKRFQVDSYNFNWDRWGCWVEFRFKGELYRFEHSIEKAKTQGIDLRSGAEAFAQVVLTLEDLARMVERGVYDLSTWVTGMRYLPDAMETPEIFKKLGFVQVPAAPEEVKDRYRNLAKKIVAAQGSDNEELEKLKQTAEQALKYFEDKGKR
ncbi:MAG TPA: J domain-containing protein [Firmicutes bacterium]|jgi:hypothetical protein|nr:J domain-containing protein [Bacillota bacterium]